VATVLGLFRSLYELDKAVNQLLSQQFQGSQIRVVTMQLTEAAPQPKGLRKWLMRGGFLGDTLDRSDGTSLMDGTIAGAIIGGLAGVIAGAAMLPGPIALGVAGILGGGLTGYLLDLLIPENRRQEYAKALSRGSTLMAVRCHNEEQRKTAELILRENQAHELGQM
jgi:hypothetical protein